MGGRGGLADLKAYEEGEQVGEVPKAVTKQ